MTLSRLPVFLLLAALVAASSAAIAKDLTPEQRALIFGKPGSVRAKRPVTRIPLQGTDHRGFYKCSYMKVFIGHHGPFTFLFDTGASFSLVTSRVIRAARIPLELDRGGYHDLVRIAEMRVGDLAIRDLVAVRDDDFGVDSVLGFKAFGDMNLTFELARRRLLVSPEPVPLPGGFEVPLELVRNLPTVPVTVGTARVAMLIDTGDDAYAWEVRSEDLAGAVLAHPPLPAEEVLNGANASSTFVSTLASLVRLGPLAIEDAVVGINDALPVPDFGVDFLQDFIFEIDPTRRVVTFQPLSPGSGQKIRGGASVGFTMKFDDRGTVSNVVPGSAAARSGMHSGDRIVRIDGRAVHRIDPRAWDKALANGKPLTVRWIQAGKERVDRFEVAPLR